MYYNKPTSYWDIQFAQNMMSKKKTLHKELEDLTHSFILHPQGLIFDKETRRIRMGEKWKPRWVEVEEGEQEVIIQSSFQGRNRNHQVEILLSLNQDFQLQSFQDKPAIQITLKNYKNNYSDMFKQTYSDVVKQTTTGEDNRKIVVSQFWMDKGELSRQGKPAVIHNFGIDHQSYFQDFTPVFLQEFYSEGRWCQTDKNKPVLTYKNESTTQNIEVFDLGKQEVKVINQTRKKRENSLDTEKISFFKSGLAHNETGPAIIHADFNDKKESVQYSLFGEGGARGLNKTHWNKRKQLVKGLKNIATEKNVKKQNRLRKKVSKYFESENIDIDFELQTLLIHQILETFDDVLKSNNRMDYCMSTITRLEEELEQELLSTYVEGEKGEDIFLSRELLDKHGIELMHFNTQTLSENEPQFLYAKSLEEKIHNMKHGVIAYLKQYVSLPLGLDLDLQQTDLDIKQTEESYQTYTSLFYPKISSLHIRSYQGKSVLYDKQNKVNTQAMKDYMVFKELFTVENLQDILNKVQEFEMEVKGYEEKIEELILLYKNHFREDIEQAKISLQQLLTSSRENSEETHQQTIQEEAEDLKLRLWKDL